jgi:phospho-N-acetylmuramoyl-pentapeptide-transferase
MVSFFTFNVIKILILATISALIAFLITPFLIKLLEKFKFWKKEARKKAITGEEAKVFYQFHKERETKVPRGGGLIIWMVTLFIILFFFILSQLTEIWWLKKLNFLSRAETWLPLFTLISASIVGFFDDLLQVFGKGKYIGGGMSLFRRLLIVVLIGIIGGWWFYFKLGWDSIHIPLVGDLYLGILYFFLFVLVIVASWAGGIVDGIDGLAGGTFLSIFSAFTIIAFSQAKYDLASFGAVIIGTLFAFLWYNIPPARFYMGETGILGLTTTMTVFAFLTDSIVVLPIIAGILVMEVGSVILQLLSKKFRNKKIWLSTPIHHHLEAIGWPPYQITMRFWILGIIFAILGVIIRLMS